MEDCLSDSQLMDLTWLSTQMEVNLMRVFGTTDARELYQKLLAYNAAEDDMPDRDPFYDITTSDVDSWLRYDDSDFYFDINTFVTGAEREEVKFGTLAVGGEFGKDRENGWRVNNPGSKFAQCLLKHISNQKLKPLLETTLLPMVMDTKAMAKKLRNELKGEDWDDPVLRLFITIYFYYDEASVSLDMVSAFMSEEELERLR